MIWTHGGINKLEVYRKLDEQYQAIPASNVLPDINLRELARFVDSPSTSHAIREYRKALAH